MSDTRRTGRPLQALSVLAAVLIGWIAGRWPLLERNVAVALSRAARAQQVASAAARTMAVVGAVPAAVDPPHFDRGSTPTREPPVLLASMAFPLAAPAQARVHARAATQGVPDVKPSWRWGSGVPQRALTLQWRTSEQQAIPPELSIVSGALTQPAVSLGFGSPTDKAAPVPARQTTAFSLATRAYAELAAGERRHAAADFDAALTVDAAARKPKPGLKPAAR